MIEVDGDVHEKKDQIEHDHAKDEYLTKQGWRVLRLRNELVLEQLDSAVEEIEKTIAIAKQR